ncbi:hypothetical protein [Asticcacaulis solisilvae]|uniref:hypothetical protein n=1 Tax=Asticcacaulis solisilvae TaxID=1217274 RepID=UPI003FD7E4E9
MIDFLRGQKMSQSQENTYRLPAPSDEEIVRFFASISKNYSSAPFNVVIGGVTIGHFTSIEQVKKANSIDLSTSKIIFGLSMEIGSVIINFYRRATIFGKNGITYDLSGFQNEIYIYSNNHIQENINIIIELVHRVEKFRENATSLLPRTTTEATLSKLFAEQIRSLSDLQKKMLRETDELRISNEKAISLRRAELESDIEKQKRKMLSELETEKNKNKAEDRRLSELQKSLDNRSHMHARRDMRNNITSELRLRLQKPSVSEEIKSHRNKFSTTCLIMIAVFFASFVVSAIEFYNVTSIGSQNTNVIITVSIRLALSFFAFAGMGFYFLGWLRQTHNDDLRTERDLERYLYDVDRSSWIIETVLEARSKESEDGKQAEIPSEWISGVTHGLFAKSEEKQEGDKAMEILASLFNFSANAKFGPQGPEFELNKGGLKKLGKAALDD